MTKLSIAAILYGSAIIAALLGASLPDPIWSDSIILSLATSLVATGVLSYV